MTLNKHKGTTFDSFLEEEGLLIETEAAAIKKVVAYELSKMMKKSHLTKTALATKMGTSRSALDRLLDHDNPSVTLITLLKAAHFSGKKLRFSFVSDIQPSI